MRLGIMVFSESTPGSEPATLKYRRFAYAKGRPSRRAVSDAADACSTGSFEWPQGDRLLWTRYGDGKMLRARFTVVAQVLEKTNRGTPIEATAISRCSDEPVLFA